MLFKQNPADDRVDNNNTRFKNGKKGFIDYVQSGGSVMFIKEQCECVRIKVVSILEKKKVEWIKKKKSEKKTIGV